MNLRASPTGIRLASEPPFTLGTLSVSPALRQIESGGRRATLEPRVMQCLVLLARRLNEVVARDELIAACWGGRIVGDEAVNRCVSRLRKAGETYAAFSIETIARVGYRLLAPGQPTRARDPTVAAMPVLAVLPFDDLSGGADLSYFADGLSEEILYILARRADLKVIGRASSFQFRGTAKAVAEVAAALNATHVLAGSVRRSGNQLRVFAELVDCTSQTIAWSDRLERPLRDIFALQDDIATAVAHALQCALAPSVRSGAVDPIAYDLFLRAAARPLRFTEESARKHAAMAEDATRRAPSFAEAWSALARMRAHLAAFLAEPDASAMRCEASAAAARALELDSNCGPAARAMALATPLGSNAIEHVRWVEHAVRATPGDPSNLAPQAEMLLDVGRNREARAVIELACRLDPLSPAAAAVHGRILMERGELQEAEAILRSGLDRWPGFELHPIFLSYVLAMKGDRDGARELAAGHDSFGPHGQRLTWFVDDHMDSTPAGDDRAITNLRRQVADTGRVLLEQLVSAAEHGHVDEALEIGLEAGLGPDPLRAEPKGLAGMLISTLFMRRLPAIRRDPRFVRLCSRLSLVDYWLASGRWPDCADEVASLYDFKAECARLRSTSDNPSHGGQRR